MVKQESPEDDQCVQKSRDSASAGQLKEERPDEAEDITWATTVKLECADGNENVKTSSASAGAGQVEEPPDEAKDISFELQLKVDASQEVSTVIDIVKCEPTLIQTLDDGLTPSPKLSHCKVGSKAAEYSRLYRERHRDEVNQRRKKRKEKKSEKGISQQIQTLHIRQNNEEIEKSTRDKTDNQLSSSALNKLRQQRYYEKHKDEINKRKRDIRLEKNRKPIPATAAERSRNYRQRNKQRINKLRRESRQRQQKAQIERMECNKDSIDSIDRMMNSTAYDLRIQACSQNITKVEQIITETSDNEQSSNPNNLKQRRYYERHKVEINKRKRDIRLKKNVKPIPATAAERSRNYRQRNKQKINEERRESRRRQLEAQSEPTECNINIDCNGQVKSSALNELQTLSNVRTINEI